MEINIEKKYKIKLITNAKDKDLTEALDIYIHTVDQNSDTSTSEIRDYIQKKYDDTRKVFFYILYADDVVVGFAEYGYLPNSEALLIDYICTIPRTPTLFYNFYQMIFEDVNKRLKKQNCYIKYIITELSLKKDNEKKYVDVDSNYFRQMLIAESFKILKVPYYQPFCDANKELTSAEFNIAIKPLLNGLFSKTMIDNTFYLGILKDIYINHYAAWYEKYMDPKSVKEFIENLLAKVSKELVKNIEIDDISLVNCALFQSGQCQQISTENITLKKKRINYIKKLIIGIVGVLFAGATAVFCGLKCFESAVTYFCSLFTILSTALTVIQIIKDRS